MRLSALFEEFCQYLRVEKEASPRSVETYRWCFGDFVAFAMQDVWPGRRWRLWAHVGRFTS